MIENTRVYEIFRRVLEEYALRRAARRARRDEGQRWLRTTEAAVLPRQSALPDLHARELDPPGHPRRAAQRRTSGCSASTSTTAPTTTARTRTRARRPPTPSSRRRSRSCCARCGGRSRTSRNQVGPNQTDVTTIANLARALFDMLRVRRQEQRREPRARRAVPRLDDGLVPPDAELQHADRPATSRPTRRPPAERLQKIGERVGLPAHSRADSYFRLADEHVAGPSRAGARARSTPIDGRAGAVPGPASSSKRCRRRSRTGRSRRVAT